MIFIKTYTTVLGDTFDKIAHEQLGSEYLLPFLLDANQKHRHVVIFESGVTINIPDLELEEYEDIPEWLISNEDDESASEGDDSNWKTEDELS